MKLNAMIKVILTLTLIMLLVLLATTVYASQAISVTIDGERVNFAGQQPAIIDGRTLVPVRGVFEQLGFDVDWNGELQTVFMSGPAHHVVIGINQAEFTVNGNPFILEVPAQIINGSTMLPIRAVVEAVGYWLGWDSVTQTVQIFRTQPEPQPPSQEEPPSRKEEPAVITADSVTIIRDGITVARADRTGVHILARILLTQEEIQSLIPHAKTQHETRMSAHPNSAMTQQELEAWNQEYDDLGGMNAFELEILYLINNIRAENNLVPFGLCPALNRASRLHTNLLAENRWTSGTRHRDIFYGRHSDRVGLFDSSIFSVGENTGSSAASAGLAVDNWMGSPAHRSLIRNAFWENPHIGVGITPNGGRTTKFSAF